jgi:hypothetical protein
MENNIETLRFIAHAKNDVPKLIAEVRRLRQELHTLKSGKD